MAAKDVIQALFDDLESRVPTEFKKAKTKFFSKNIINNISYRLREYPLWHGEAGEEHSGAFVARLIDLLMEDIAKKYGDQPFDFKYDSKEFLQNNWQKAIQPILDKAGIEEPQVVIHDNNVRQRRMDALAKVLSVSGKYSACLAFAYGRDNELVLATSYPRVNQEDSPEVIDRKKAELTTFLENRVAIVRNFIQDIINGEDSSLTYHPRSDSVPEQRLRNYFTPRGLFLAIQATERLMHPDFGASSLADQQMMLKALLKIAMSFLVALRTEGQQGFSEGAPSEEEAAIILAEVRAFMEPSTRVNVYIEDPVDGLDIHPDQAIVHYLVDNDLIGYGQRKRNVGISKQCCQPCFEYLRFYADQDWLTFRAGSGQTFYGTFDSLHYEAPISRNPTKLFVSDHHDSDSEPEIWPDRLDPALSKMAEQFGVAKTKRRNHCIRLFDSADSKLERQAEHCGVAEEKNQIATAEKRSQKHPVISTEVVEREENIVSTGLSV